MNTIYLFTLAVDWDLVPCSAVSGGYISHTPGDMGIEHGWNDNK